MLQGYYNFIPYIHNTPSTYELKIFVFTSNLEV
jgi:hypothetical protein